MKNLYAIRDRVANDLVTLQMYSVFGFKTDQQAIRYFADAIYDDKSVLAKHPDDYELIRCGSIADDGTLTVEPQHDGIHPVVIVTGSTLKAAQENK